MKTTFTFVRHGQTDWNKKGFVQGSSDVPLNATGIQQAITKAPFFANKTYTHAFSSPLVRAQVTLETILEFNQITIPIQLDKRLQERSFGLVEGRSVLFLRHIREHQIALPGYETNAELEARLHEFLTNTARDLPEANIIVTAHSHVLKAAHRAIQPTLPKLSYAAALDNLGVLIFVFDHDTKTWEIPYTELNNNEY